jgi:L-methionine (R)-S-oxide reductase
LTDVALPFEAVLEPNLPIVAPYQRLWDWPDAVLTACAAASKPAVYRDLRQQLAALFAAERNVLANAANLCALLYWTLPDLNWAGFYFLEQGELVLGPFQGKVACVRIAIGKGACGGAALRRQTLIVADVHEFPGHIACDAATQSEIVVPLLQGERLWGVLDLDSPKRSRFDAEDAAGLRTCAADFIAASDLAKFFGG